MLLVCKSVARVCTAAALSWESLWSPITQLETCWFYTIGILQTGEISWLGKFYQRPSRNVLSVYCLIGHTFQYLRFPFLTSNCFGVDLIKALWRNSLSFKGSPFYVLWSRHEFSALVSYVTLTSDHPEFLDSSSHHRDTEAAWQGSWRVTSDLRDATCDAGVPCSHVSRSRPLYRLSVIIATGCLSQSVYNLWPEKCAKFNLLKERKTFSKSTYFCVEWMSAVMLYKSWIQLWFK